VKNNRIGSEWKVKTKSSEVESLTVAVAESLCRLARETFQFSRTLRMSMEFFGCGMN
jgi:IS1 family transposase